MVRGYALAILSAGLALTAASAADRTTLTRKAQDLYKIDGESRWLRTQHCFEFAYGEEAILGEHLIKFGQGRSTCDIVEQLEETPIGSGDHAVTVSRVEADLYTIDHSQYLRTRSCFERAYGRTPILRSVGTRRGTLIFDDNAGICTVETLLSVAR